MEIVARRKHAAKDVPEKVVEAEAEAPLAQPAALWRSWTFCLLFGWIFLMCGGICVRWSSYGATMAKTRVAVNFQQLSKLPAISALEDLGTALPDPLPSIYVQDAVVFPDNVMLLVRGSSSLNLEASIDSLECRFGDFSSTVMNKSTSPVISIKPRTRNVQMVRCSRPDEIDFSSKLNNNVTLGIRDSDVRVESNALYHPASLPTWEALVYENLLDLDSLVLLAKGLVSKSSRRIELWSLKCVFGTNLPAEVLFQTSVLTAAQEVIRCEKPPAHLEDNLRGQKVSVKASWLGVLPSVTYYDPDNRPGSFLASFLNPASVEDFSAVTDVSNVATEEDFFTTAEGQVMSSVELPTVDGDEKVPLEDPVPRRKLCACTMVWNKAQFIREWVVFHTFMGVEKYFFYDNDCDDDTEDVLNSLSSYNISRMVWPWIKTQQAAFSHCTILARDECEWMMFTDVDEYIYPYAYLRKEDHSEGSDAMVLHRLIDSESEKVDKRTAGILGQIQFHCHNFGPSGLNSTPEEGVTMGYTCRSKNPQRHKSIIMLDAVNSSLLNVLHHFELQDGYISMKFSRTAAVVNHYKFQAWDAFRMKFVRRAGTYTTDWQKSENTGSNDRTPGLGTDAVKPSDWESRFCDVHDTGLREFALRTFALPGDPVKMEWQLGQTRI